MGEFTSFFAFRFIRYLDIMRREVLQLDLLGLELSAERCAIKCGTKNGSFVCINVL